MILIVSGFYSENAMRETKARALCILDTKAKLKHTGNLGYPGALLRLAGREQSGAI